MLKIPYTLARAIVKGAFIKFKFKGRNIGSSNHFPMQYKPKLLIEMPEFKSGNEFVESGGIKWVRVMEATG